MIHVLTQSIVYFMCMQFLHFKLCLAYTYDHNDLTLCNLLRAPYPTVIMETQTQLWEQWNTTSLPMDSNNIGLINPTPTTYSANLVASALLSAGAPTRKGVYRLNCPEIPFRRRSADELPGLQSTDNQN